MRATLGFVEQDRMGFVQPWCKPVHLTRAGKVSLMVHPKLDVSRFGDDGDKGAFVLASKSAHPRIYAYNQSRESSRAKISRDNELADPVLQDPLTFEYPIPILRIAGEHSPTALSNQRQNIGIFFSTGKVLRINTEFDIGG